MGGKLHVPAILTSGQGPRTQSMRGWVGPTADLHEYGEMKMLFLCAQFHIYEGWNFNSGNYLFTTDTK